MIIYGGLDPMPKHRTPFFKGKRKHIAKVNVPNVVYLNQNINVEISHDPRDHVIVPDTVKITFNLDIESEDKTRYIVKMQVEHQ